MPVHTDHEIELEKYQNIISELVNQLETMKQNSSHEISKKEQQFDIILAQSEAKIDSKTENRAIFFDFNFSKSNASV